MESPDVDYMSSNRAILTIPYSLNKDKKMMISGARDCQGILRCLTKGEGVVKKIGGTDFEECSEYVNSQTAEIKSGSELISVSNYDRLNLTKILWGRIEYIRTRQINGRIDESQLIITVGPKKSSKGNPIVEVEYLKIDSSVGCCCFGKPTPSLIESKEDIKHHGVSLQEFFKTYTYKHITEEPDNGEIFVPQSESYSITSPIPIETPSYNNIEIVQDETPLVKRF